MTSTSFSLTQKESSGQLGYVGNGYVGNYFLKWCTRKSSVRWKRPYDDICRYQKMSSVHITVDHIISGGNHLSRCP